MTEAIIIAGDVPIPAPTKKVFRIQIKSEDEAEIDKIIESLKVVNPDVVIKDTRSKA